MTVANRRFYSIVTVLMIAALGMGASVKASSREEEARRSLQRIIDELTKTMGVSSEVRARIVASNPLLVSVEPSSEGRHFDLSFQQSFLAGLTDDEMRTIVAHELGHVWIFTHHPYLQTERLANDIALRVVTRDSLARVYDKVWATHGVKGDLARFLPAPH